MVHFREGESTNEEEESSKDKMEGKEGAISFRYGEEKIVERDSTWEKKHN